MTTDNLLILCNAAVIFNSSCNLDLSHKTQDLPVCISKSDSCGTWFTCVFLRLQLSDMKMSLHNSSCGQSVAVHKARIVCLLRIAWPDIGGGRGQTFHTHSDFIPLWDKRKRKRETHKQQFYLVSLYSHFKAAVEGFTFLSVVLSSQINSYLLLEVQRGEEQHQPDYWTHRKQLQCYAFNN